MEENHKNAIPSLPNPPPGSSYTNQAYVNSDTQVGTYPANPDVGKDNTSVRAEVGLSKPSHSTQWNHSFVKRSKRKRIIGTVVGCFIGVAIVGTVVVVAISLTSKTMQGNSVEGSSKSALKGTVEVEGSFTWENPSTISSTNHNKFCSGVKTVFGTTYNSCNITSSYGSTFYFCVTVKSDEPQKTLENSLFDSMKTDRAEFLKAFKNMEINNITIGASLSWEKARKALVRTTTRHPTKRLSTTVSSALNCDFKKTLYSNNIDFVYFYKTGRLRFLVSDYGVCNYGLGVSARSTGEYRWGTGNGNSGLSGTGPFNDHFGSSDGYYVFTQASNGRPGDWTQLRSPTVSLYDNLHCLNFWYHMYGDHIGRLSLYLFYPDNSMEVLWNRTREQGNEWRKAFVRLPRGSFKVAFMAYMGLGRQAEIALDQISVTTGTCQEAAVCDSNEFRCGTGECIAKDLKCDHVNNCPDKSDEVGCSCPIGQQSCLNEDKCIANDWKCDGHQDCKSGSDENGCNKCQITEFTCTNYECVQAPSRCDGVEQCKDGSDEKECGTSELSANSISYTTHLNFRGTLYRMCSDNWSSYHSELFCSSNGLGMVEKLSLYKATVGGSYLKVSAQHNAALQMGAVITSSCPSGKIVGVKCRVPEFSCGTRSSNLQFSSSYIFGGQDVQLGAWPWQVLILKDGHPSCGGTIINQNWILTAAHCVEDAIGGVEPAYKFRVVVGNRRLDGSDSTARTLDISSITQHENYTTTNTITTNDVAVMKLRNPLSYNDYIRPVCLPEHEQTFPLSSLCYVSGYGYVDEFSTPTTYQQEAKIQLVSTSVCSSYYSRFTIDSKQFCAGYDSALIDTCSGDSGGPLVCLDQRNRWVQVGVTSWGYSVCGLTKYGVYVNINQFTPWIKQNTGV